MSSKLVPFSLLGISLAGLAAVLYPTVLQPRLRLAGVVGRDAEMSNVNNAQCQKIPTLRSCEDTWLHPESGFLYAACGNSPEDRQTWFPCNDHWDALKRPTNDYLAVLDTHGEGSYEERTRKVKLQGFHGLFGEGSFTSHGMGFWHTPDSDELTIFLVNHRPSLDATTSAIILDENTGANSTIEIFRSTLGSDEAHHVRTVAHPLVRTPNNIEGTGPDSFYVTNDHHVKRGNKKVFDMFMPWTEVAHCDADGCKVALDGIVFANGISRSATRPDIFFLSSTMSDKFFVLQRQPDDKLVVLDTLTIPYATDNVFTTAGKSSAAADADADLVRRPKTSDYGSAYIAAFPKPLEVVEDAFKHPRTHGAAAAVIKVSKSKPGDQGAFYGQKYTVERVFEDDDKTPDSPSGITGAAIDEDRRKMYLASLYQPWMYECDWYEPSVPVAA